MTCSRSPTGCRSRSSPELKPDDPWLYLAQPAHQVTGRRWGELKPRAFWIPGVPDQDTPWDGRHLYTLTAGASAVAALTPAISALIMAPATTHHAVGSSGHAPPQP